MSTFKRRVYYDVSDDSTASRHKLKYDSKNDAWYQFEDQSPILTLRQISDPRFTEVPQHLKLYLASTITDNATLKTFKCRFDPTYSLWYTVLAPVDSDPMLEHVGEFDGVKYGANANVLKLFKPAFHVGHRLRKI